MVSMYEDENDQRFSNIQWDAEFMQHNVIADMTVTATK